LLEARIGGCLERKRLRALESVYEAVVQGRVGEAGQVSPPAPPSSPREDRDSERLARLRRFLSPQLAELISSSEDESVLESHRREITVAFCDLRGFTSFAESAEPEDVMNLLREYHAAMGEIIFQHQGTLERFTGDGMMVFFNDPVPLSDPAGHAARMAVAMRDRASQLAPGWLNRGYDLGFGMGIAMGYATLGRIGFEGRFDYGAIGSVTNMASRLCDEAAAGQILISRRVWSTIEGLVEVEPIGGLQLKGFRRPVEAFNIARLKSASR
jgi:class 3 adenylate cyclase